MVGTGVHPQYHPPKNFNLGEQDHGYLYLPLDFATREIRILALDMTNGDISCSLEHVSLIEPGSYIALSYYWGGSSKEMKICIGLSMVPVTYNLYSALHAIWRTRHKIVKSVSQPIRVWVDAVCINQNDHQERSQQVCWMGQIYDKAEQVIAWVGPSKGMKMPSNSTKPLQDLLNWGEGVQ